MEKPSLSCMRMSARFYAALHHTSTLENLHCKKFWRPSSDPFHLQAGDDCAVHHAGERGEAHVGLPVVPRKSKVPNLTTFNS